MTQTPVATLTEAEEGNYCLHLKSDGHRLVCAFSKGNTVKVFDAATNSEVWRVPAEVEGLLSEVSWVSESVIACCATGGHLLLYDIRQGAVPTTRKRENEELFSVDCSGYSIAVSGERSVLVWDVRSFDQKQKYTDAHVPGSDITNVRFSPLYPNVLASCSEDALLAIYNVEVTAEDDFSVISLEDAGLQLGWDGLNVFSVSLSSYQLWQPNLDNNEAPSTLLQKLTIAEVQVQVEDFNYFLPMAISRGIMLGGSNE